MIDLGWIIGTGFVLISVLFKPDLSKAAFWEDSNFVTGWFVFVFFLIVCFGCRFLLDCLLHVYSVILSTFVIIFNL